MSDDLHVKASELFGQVMELPYEDAISVINKSTENDEALREYTLNLYTSFAKEKENFGQSDNNSNTQEHITNSSFLQKKLTQSSVNEIDKKSFFRKRKNWLTVALVLLLVIAGFFYGTIVRNKLINSELREHQAFLNSQSSIVEHWMVSEKMKIKDLAKLSIVQSLCRELLEQYNKKGKAYLTSNSPQLEEFTQELKKLSKSEQVLGMSIIHANTPITFISTGLIGEKTKVSILNGQMLGDGGYKKYLEVIKGKTVFVPPLTLSEQVDVLTNPIDNYFSECHFATPVYSEGNIIGVLSMSLSSEATFSRLFENALTLDETNVYAFNKNGQILSSTLKYDGDDTYLADPLKVKLKYNNEPTSLFSDIQEKLTHDPVALKGHLLKSYYDYNGNDVVGSWVWFPSEEFGLIYEQNQSVFYQSVHLFDLTYLLSVLVVLIFGGIIIKTDFQLNLLNKKLQKLGQYHLLEKIGEGGFGEVFKGEHQLLKQPVAIKLLKKSFNDTDALDRFRKEVMVTASLHHPNTIRVFDYGHNHQNQFYYVMEYLHGISLEELLIHNKKIEIGRGLHILLQVGYSLMEAHQKGLLHRDIKPANIMVCNQGGAFDTVKLLDFGLVKEVNTIEHTKLNRIGGTPMFMAPERLHDPFNADVRQDIYALGAVGLYMFSGKYIVELISQKMLQGVDSIDTLLNEEVFDRKDLPTPLIQLFFQCVSFNVDERPSRVLQFIQILREIAKDYPWTVDDAQQSWKAYDVYG
ncbi:serine/threonine protein kinase [Flammeovirga agarivorans]|uniref:Serine/threonine protein kinase n=1 Tax=Flammeovirga agarivorans TaxID=2726742 RepID=A0A7X8SGC1_9BACT|nr:serine/threonine-protein kinase [Flammeovirga agarivorans]NLR89754.1 serine/threonine protein kinase [Flammeovirga agarivorans]